MSGYWRTRVEGPQKMPNDIAADLHTAMVKAMGLSMQAVAAEARATAPVKTGAYRRSITVDKVTVQGSTISGAVGAGGGGAPYAQVIEYGSGVYSDAPDATHKPIIIVPIHAKALAWPSSAVGAGGASRRLSGNLRTGARRRGVAMQFARRVVQQGQRPKHIIRSAVDNLQGVISDYLKDAAEAVFAKIK